MPNPTDTLSDRLKAATIFPDGTPLPDGAEAFPVSLSILREAIAAVEERDALRELVDQLATALEQAECISMLEGEIAELEKYGSADDAKALRELKRDLKATRKQVAQALAASAALTQGRTKP